MKLLPAPATRRDDVVDVLHGVEVADPYRWLEDGASAETRAWVDAQNFRTRTALDSLPDRPQLRRRLEQLLRTPVRTAPRLAGDRIFSLDRGGEHDQAVLAVRSAVDGDEPARILVDPARGADDAAVAIDWYHPSPDGRLVAYGTSEGGSERSTLRVLDLDTGSHRPDAIPHTRAASVAWLPDSSAFAYTRYPDPDDVGEEASQYHRHVRWHVLGHDATHDEVLWGDDELPDPTAWPDVRLSLDGRWMLVHVRLGWQRIDVHLIDRLTGARTVLVEGQDAVTDLRVAGDRLYGVTTLGAARGRVVTARIDEPTAAGWQTLVPESDAVIEEARVAGASLLVLSREAAVYRLDRIRLDGTGAVEVPLPAGGWVGGLTADPGQERAFLTFESFTTPPSTLRWTPAGVEPWAAEDSPLDDLDYAVEATSYRSTDGTDVPILLVRRASTRPAPGTPALLTGYGGFGITMTPAFSPLITAFADAGGLVAVAGLRGGTEHGEDWHRAGMGPRKQQVFDDFAAAADWLVAEGLTGRDRLAIRGGSNGGLLVGATISQRPDLCRAVHCAVPLLDMVRFHRFLIARLWIPEYGDPDVADDFAWLHAYSPYHHVTDGTCFPAVLLTTAESDTRVDPCHARKFAARLQAATACGDDHPVLLHIESRAGHGQGKPVGKQADEAADVLAFLLEQLGVEVPAGG